MMTPDSIEATVLLIEDGDEYLDNLSRFVPGPRYIQVHTGGAALTLLETTTPDLIYLDMRFDRIPRSELLGDHVVATREHNGDPERAWRYLETNQGLFILAALRQAGFGAIPVILAYDFSRENKRLGHLQRLHPTLRWVPDAVTPQQIRSLMNTLAHR